MFSKKLSHLPCICGILAVVLSPFGLWGQVPHDHNDTYASQFRAAVMEAGQLPPWTGAVLVSTPGFSGAEAALLADTMAAVAIDLLRDPDEETAGQALALASSIIRSLRNAGSWPEERSRGIALDGAGDRLIRIAAGAPNGRRLIPLGSLLWLPDQERWLGRLVTMAGSDEPISLDAVTVLWDFDSVDPASREGDKAMRREMVLDLYRRNALGPETARLVELLRGPGR